MTFVRQTAAAVALIILSLWVQSGGMAALIGSVRTSLGPGTHKLGPLRSAVLMVRFTAAIIALHVLQILMWGLSASFLFTMVTRLVEGEVRFASQLTRLVTQLRPTPKDSTLSALR